jgi:hypothetical protein
MNRTQAEELLLKSTLIRNVCCAVVLSVLAGFMLYELVTPADQLPAVADTRGGIPVVNVNDIPAIGYPGMPPSVINALMDDAQKIMADATVGAKRYVAENVSCNNGVAWVAIKNRDAIEHVSFKPLQNIRDAQHADNGAITITCIPETGYQSNSRALTDIEVAIYAMDVVNQPQ